MDSILILQLHGLQVSKSFKIKYGQNLNLYLYPKDYFERLSKIDTFLEELESFTEDPNSLLMPEFLKFEIGNDRATFIIAKVAIDVYQDKKTLFREVSGIFGLFLRLNSFIFEFTIDIQKVFLFLKQGKEFRLIRIIDRRIVIDKNNERIIKYQLDNYNKELESLFDKIRNSDLLQDIVKILYEFIVARNNPVIEMKIMYYWNYLEHIAQIYASHHNRNLLIDKQKFEKLQEKVLKLVNKKLESVSLNPLDLTQIEHKIRELFNSEFNKGESLFINKPEWRSLLRTVCGDIKALLEDSDVLIDEYDKGKVSTLIIKYLDNFPPSEKLIELVLNDIGYITNELENRILEIMKVARNYLFHTSLRLEGLYQKFIDDYDDITSCDLNDLISALRRFEEFLIKATTRILGTNIMKEKKHIADKGLYIRHPSIEKYIGREETFIDKVRLIKKSFRSNRDYEDLIKIIIKKDKQCDEALQHTTMKGYCFGQEDKKYKEFKLEFLNKYKAQGRFEEGISSAQTYDFYIDLKKNNFELESMVQFEEIIRFGFLSNLHNVYIRVLDFWFDRERAYELNRELLNLLNGLNYNNH